MDIKAIRNANLRLLVDEAGSIAAVAAKAGTDDAYLSQLLNSWQDRAMGSKVARKLEVGFGRPSGWMDVDHSGAVREHVETDYSTIKDASARATRLPLISLVQAGTWSDNGDPYPPGFAERWVTTRLRVSKSSYAVEVVGDSMEPDFPEGTLLIVDPEVSPRHRSFVVVRLPGSGEATFKQLMLDGGLAYLKPLNGRYQVMRMPEDAHICGVVKSAAWEKVFD